MTVDTTRLNYTIEDYFAIEAESKHKLEYYNGKIKVMSGGTPAHNEIAANVIHVLKTLIKQLKGKKYKLYTSDMNIWVGPLHYFVYPDAAVICEKPVLYEGRKDIITNPLLIVEVLSPSTEDYDRGPKFLLYEGISTFKEYVLLRQNEASGMVFFREEEDLWRKKEAHGMDGTLPLRSLGCELPLGDIYEDVDFPDVESEKLPV